MIIFSTLCSQATFRMEGQQHSTLHKASNPSSKPRDDLGNIHIQEEKGWSEQQQQGYHRGLWTSQELNVHVNWFELKAVCIPSLVDLCK